MLICWLCVFFLFLVAFLDDRNLSIFCCNGQNCLVVVVLMFSTGRLGCCWCCFSQVVAWVEFMDAICHGQKITKQRFIPCVRSKENWMVCMSSKDVCCGKIPSKLYYNTLESSWIAKGLWYYKITPTVREEIQQQPLEYAAIGVNFYFQLMLQNKSK